MSGNTFYRLKSVLIVRKNKRISCNDTEFNIKSVLKVWKTFGYSLKTPQNRFFAEWLEIRGNLWYNRSMDIFYGLLIPFLGTALGSACVFLMNRELNVKVQKLLLGFASGVMIAASVWSLIIPSIESSENLGNLAFLPAAVGIALGMLFLFLLDIIIPHLHMNSDRPEGLSSKLKETAMLCLAVTLHNIPEGMAVGVVFAGVLSGTAEISLAGAFALSIGIAVQNFPEGAIISMPLRAHGNSKLRSFIYGSLSGIVEPAAAFITILLTGVIVPLLPYLLSFAAGAMLYVVVEELIPEASAGEHSNNCTVGFALGFILMMILDVALG